LELFAGHSVVLPEAAVINFWFFINVQILIAVWWTECRYLVFIYM